METDIFYDKIPVINVHYVNFQFLIYRYIFSSLLALYELIVLLNLMKLFIFFISFFWVCMFANSQVKSDFRFADVHLNNDRSGYSMFYPITTQDYKGIVVLIHDRQNINPKAYGGIIENILKQNFIVIYPHYESFLISNTKMDMNYIDNALEQSKEDLKNSMSMRSGLPYILIGHGTGAILVQKILQKKEYRNIKGALLVAPAYSNQNILDVDLMDISIVVVEEENSKTYRKLNKSGKTYGLNGRKIQTLLHLSNNQQKAKRKSFKSYVRRFSSRNNGIKDYGIGLDKPNTEDRLYYYPLIQQFLSCVIEGKQCDYSQFSKPLLKSK